MEGFAIDGRDIAHIALVIIVVSVIFFLLSILIPRIFVTKDMVFDHEKRLSLRNEYTKTVAQIFGGIALLCSFGYTLLKDSDTRRQDLRLKASAQVREAVTMLSSDNESVRAGAIVVLSKALYFEPSAAGDVTSIIEVHARNLQQSPKGYQKCFQRPPTVSADVQLAINLLSKWRSSSYYPGENCNKPLALNDAINLRQGYLFKASFEGTRGYCGSYFEQSTILGANFRNADLKYAQFGGANLEDWKTYGNCDANGDPRKDNMDDELHKMKEWERYYYGADFTGAILIGANFQDAGLTGAIFNKADLSGTSFKGANIGRADFRGSLNLNARQLAEACADDVFLPPDGMREEGIKVERCSK
ncbi:pentapeptide repeat-containing protein [Azospirillum melinis]|uniref:pentapeptide repeat-containing protein n=1 Tax=Azospirillum melinis TaxID=328839 RepID=UPI0037568BED